MMIVTRQPTPDKERIMGIFWNSSIRQPGRIEGDSRSWTDDGVPLSYRVLYCHDSQEWTAHFEGALVRRGTLPQCLSACEAADITGIFVDHPDMPKQIAPEST